MITGFCGLRSEFRRRVTCQTWREGARRREEEEEQRLMPGRAGSRAPQERSAMGSGDVCFAAKEQTGALAVD